MALAGRYGYLLDAAARNPSRTIAASALGAGLLGGASSVIGNLVDKEQGEGPLRVVSEATDAGILSAVPGALTGFSAAVM